MTTQTTHYRARLGSLVALFVVGTLVASLPAGVVAAQHTVAPGATISTAGTHELAPDASNTTASRGLTVTASPVEIDGRQSQLAGPDTRRSIGIYVPDAPPESSLVVRNLTLSGWGTGIRTSNVSTVTIRDTVVRSNHTGVQIEGATTVRIENSTLVVDDGTVFEDVDRVVLENTSIRTDDSQSILAVNTTVFVGKNVSLTGGVRVRRGVVKLDNETATPTAAPESGDTDSDTETPPTSETETTTTVPQTAQSTATPPTGVESILRRDGGGSVGGGGGGSAVSAPQDDTATPRESTLSNETEDVSNTTTTAVAEESDSTPDATNTTASRDEGDSRETTTRDSPRTQPTATVATAQAGDVDESTAVRTPGFGGVVALTSLGVWSVRRVRSD